jgi:Flp pilus assembly protein TadG
VIAKLLHSSSSGRLPRLFAGDRRGLAAVEFAMLLPFMLVLYVGVTEVGKAIAISRKVTLTVRTVTDLVTQYSALSTADMSTLVNASAQVMAPYPSSNLVVTVSEVSTDASGNATITWSTSLNGTAYTTGQTVTLPSAISKPNISLIWGQVQYNYTPIIGYHIIGTKALTDQIYMNPRLCGAISYGPSVVTSTKTADCPAASGSSGSSGSGSSGGTTGGGTSGGGSSGGGHGGGHHH